MRTTDTIIIGAGQAGLAASHCLTERGHDHVVLERGHLGQRWTADTWDSLRLLTPNWMNELPGWAYRGPDPHGYMTAAEFMAHLADYAALVRRTRRGAHRGRGASVSRRRLRGRR